MAFSIGSGFLDLTVDDDQFNSSLEGVQGRLQKTNASLIKVSDTARNLLLVGAAAAGGLLRLFSESEKASARLEAVITATGGAAGLTAEQLEEEAASLQKLTGISDEAVIGTQAILATFKNVKGDVFKDATKAILDMAVVLDQDAKAGAIQLGKALNDPIKGVGALSEVGVSFTQQQRDQIRVLQESGDIMGAQTIILKELQAEFGGAAKAVGDTFGGAISKAKEEVRDLGEELGQALAPTILDIVENVREVIPAIKQWVEENSELIGTVVRTSARLGIFLVVVPRVIAIITTLGATLASLQVSLAGGTTALAGFTGGLGLLAAVGAVAVLIAINSQLEEAAKKSAEIRQFNKEIGAIEAELGASARTIVPLEREITELKKDQTAEGILRLAIAESELAIAKEILGLFREGKAALAVAQTRKDLVEAEEDLHRRIASLFGLGVSEAGKLVIKLTKELEVRERTLDSIKNKNKALIKGGAIEKTEGRDAERRLKSLKTIPGVETEINKLRLAARKLLEPELKERIEGEEKIAKIEKEIAESRARLTPILTETTAGFDVLEKLQDAQDKFLDAQRESLAKAGRERRLAQEKEVRDFVNTELEKKREDLLIQESRLLSFEKTERGRALIVAKTNKELDKIRLAELEAEFKDLIPKPDEIRRSFTGLTSLFEQIQTAGTGDEADRQKEIAKLAREQLAVEKNAEILLGELVANTAGGIGLRLTQTRSG